jgi:hypothetical protein
MVLIGAAGTFWGLIQNIPGAPMGVPSLAVVALSIALIAAGLRIHSARLFLLFASVCWLVTRGSMVLLFPRFQLMGDERYFHEFVVGLVQAMAHGNISSLSSSYDFPVWLARAFPFYLPLGILFGANDVMAARWLNVLLGAGQMVCLFVITRRLMSAHAARVVCLLLLVFPYHLINVLSYDPQIAGTFFLLIALWMFLSMGSVGRAVCLGLALACAGIQRGGIDYLLIAVMLLSLLLRRTSLRNALVCAAAVCLVWLPLRLGFDHWVTSQDKNLLRTHTLGFMTRGWNLDTAGEYLPLYEQLDIASAAPEKQRTLEAVLITEFAREPVRSLFILAPVKIAKFFALGYASTAEQGLAAGGYLEAVCAYQLLRAICAPLLLALCLLGLIRCWQSAALQRRFLVPVLFIVISCAAIVLIWETSPRYSHPIQFAVLILAAAGLAGFSRSCRAISVPRFVLDFASSGAAIALGWVMLSLCVVGIARSATNYQFLDPRALRAALNQNAIAVEPLHAFSSSWEGAIRLPAGTVLPATVQVSFPVPRMAAWDHLSVSIWLPDPVAGSQVCQVLCRAGKMSAGIPAAASGRIARIQIPRTGADAAVLSLSISSASGQRRTAAGMRLGIGYALAN